jgi:hypothetical protein
MLTTLHKEQVWTSYITERRTELGPVNSSGYKDAVDVHMIKQDTNTDACYEVTVGNTV